MKNETTVTRETLLDSAAAKLPRGFRFVAVTCSDVGETHDLIYTFEKDQEIYNLRLNLPKGEEAPSISVVFFAAALAENEIKDLFGVNFRGLAIDYEGRFLLSQGAPRAPMNKSGSKSSASALSNDVPGRTEGRSND